MCKRACLPSTDGGKQHADADSQTQSPYGKDCSMDTVVIYGRAVNFVLTVDPNRVAEGIVELATVWDIQMRVGRANKLLIFRRV